MFKSHRASAVLVAAVVSGTVFTSGANGAISGGAYTGTQTTPHTFQVPGLNVVANNATFVGSATGTSVTDFRATYSDVRASIAGVAFKARITTASDWRIKQPTPNSLSLFTYSGSVQIFAPMAGDAVTIDVVNQAYSAGGVITGSPAILGRVTVNATGSSALTTVRMTPGPPSVLTANITGIAYQVVPGYPLSTVIGNGTGTYTGSVSTPGVTVSANP